MFSTTFVKGKRAKVAERMSRLMCSIAFSLFLFLPFLATTADAQRKTDPLDRGLVGVPANGGGIYLSWRVQADEYYNVTYKVYRGGSLIAQNLTTSNYVDTSGNTSSTYTVAAVKNGTEGTQCAAVTPWAQQYLEIPMANVQSSGGITVWTKEKGALMEQGNYVINEVSLGDVDGDGKIDFIVKRLNEWDQNNLFPTDNWQFFAHIECYASSINYGRLWWIDCGRNIVYGADKQFDAVAFDWNQDGKCEVLYRGGAGTVLHHNDGTTETIGDANENIRGGVSHVANLTFSNSGEEWLMYIDGSTGKTFDVISYPIPRGNASDWGDGYGHRSSKYFMGAPYLDGQKPYIFLGRGIYTKIVACTYEVTSGNKLQKVGNTWESHNNAGWYGQGNHNYNIADVDEDGADEIIYGSMVLDFHTSDKSLHGMSSTGLGHGDAIHTGDLDPYRKGLETFACNEEQPFFNYRNAATCEIYARKTGSGDDGRAMAGNFSNDYPGGIGASTSSGIVPLSKRQANPLAPTYIDGLDNNWNGQTPSPMALNFRLYWDGDLCSESLNGPGSNESYLYVDKNGGRIFSTTPNGKYETACINSTKKNPSASGDIIGDWREEIVMRTSDNKYLRIYTTNTHTTYRMQSLWYDHQYRQAMVWQTEGYNQPPHPSFFVGEMEGLTAAPPAYTKYQEVPINNEISSNNHGGKDVLIMTDGNENIRTIKLLENAHPATVFFNSRTTIEGGDEVKYKETKSKFDRIYITTDNRTYGFGSSTNLCKQGGAALHLPYTTHTHTGKTDVWAGALVCNGSITNSPIWANRHTELFLGCALAGYVSTYKSIEMEYGSALYITDHSMNVQGKNAPATNDNGYGHMTVTNELFLKEGSRVVFDIKGNANADGDKLNITGNLTIRKRTGDKWENYGPEYLQPIFEFKASKPLTAGSYLIGEYNTANTADLADIKLVCSTEGGIQPNLEVKNGKLYLVIGGNSAQAVAGDYYIMNVASGTYMSIGSNWKTHLTVDGQGKVITLSGTEGNLLMHVAGIDANQYVGLGSWSNKASTEGDYTAWTFEPTTVTGYTYAYKIKANKNGNYLKWKNQNISFNEVWSADFSEAPTGISYWGPGQSLNDYLHFVNNESGDRGMNISFTDTKFNVEGEWRLDYDIAFSSSNTNPSSITFNTNKGLAFNCAWGIHAGALVTVSDASGNNLVTNLPIAGYNNGTMNNASHVTLHGVPSEGVYLTITQGSTTYVNYAKVTSSFGYPASLSGSLGKGASHLMLDNFSFKTAQTTLDVPTQNQVITVDTNGDSDEYKWVLVAKSVRENLAEASADNPKDATFKVNNPDFEYAKTNGSTVLTGSNNGKHIEQWTDNNDFWYQNSSQPSFTGLFAEIWSSSNLPDKSISQSLSGLPQGTYMLTANVNANVNAEGKTNAFLYAGENKTEIVKTGEISVYGYAGSDGNLQIALKTESAVTDWVSFDKVRLNYYGDITIAKLLFPEENAEYLAAVAAAEAFAEKLSGDAKTSFQTSINALKVNVNSNDITAEALLDAAEAIHNAMKNLTIDMTSAITDAPVTDKAKWINGNTQTGQQYTGAPDNTYLDITWNQTADIHQDNINLPAGKYVMKCATRGSASTNGYVYIKSGDNVIGREDVHKDGSTGGELGNGWSWTYIPFEIAADGNVTIGFYANHSGNHWAGVDDFSLTYYGEEFPMFDVTINAVDSEGNIIRTIKSGEMQIGTYVSFPFAMEEQGSWYTINQPAKYSEQIIQSGTINRTYTFEPRMVAFVEGESGVRDAAGHNYSGGYIGYAIGQNKSNRGIVLGNLPKGRYTFVANIITNQARGVYLRDANSTEYGNNVLAQFSTTGTQSADFVIAEDKNTVINGYTYGDGANQSADFDYAYVLRLGDNYMDTYAARLEKMRQSLDDAGREALGNENPLDINSTEDQLNAALAALETNYLNVAKANQENYLTRLVAEATTSHPTGQKMFDYNATSEATTALNTAISATNAVKEKASATADEVMTQIDAMRLANETYIASLKYNGPAENTRYLVKLGNTPLTRLEEDGMWFPTFKKADVDVNYIQAFMLEPDPVQPLSYNLAFTNAAGQKQYLGNNGDDLYGVAITSDQSQAFSFTVERSDNYATSDVIYLRNPKLGNNYLNVVNDANKALRTGLVGDGKPNFTITEASKATPSFKAYNEGTWSTFITPFAMAVPANVEVYTVGAELNDDKLALTEITSTIPANTPVLLKNTSGEDVFITDQSDYGTASADDYSVGLLTGRYSNATLPVSNEEFTYYILQLQTGTTDAAFYRISKDRNASPYRCYLSIRKANPSALFTCIYFPSDEELTGIENIDFDALPVIDEIFNTSGIKIATMQKGLNIVKFKDGTTRKVLNK